MAPKNVVPNDDGGSLGRADKPWDGVYADHWNGNQPSVTAGPSQIPVSSGSGELDIDYIPTTVASEANKVVKTDGTGKIDLSMIPNGVEASFSGPNQFSQYLTPVTHANAIEFDMTAIPTNVLWVTMVGGGGGGGEGFANGSFSIDQGSMGNWLRYLAPGGGGAGWGIYRQLLVVDPNWSSIFLVVGYGGRRTNNPIGSQLGFQTWDGSPSYIFGPDPDNDVIMIAKGGQGGQRIGKINNTPDIWAQGPPGSDGQFRGGGGVFYDCYGAPSAALIPTPGNGQDSPRFSGGDGDTDGGGGAASLFANGGGPGSKDGGYGSGGKGGTSSPGFGGNGLIRIEWYEAP